MRGWRGGRGERLGHGLFPLAPALKEERRLGDGCPVINRGNGTPGEVTEFAPALAEADPARRKPLERMEGLFGPGALEDLDRRPPQRELPVEGIATTQEGEELGQGARYARVLEGIEDPELNPRVFVVEECGEHRLGLPRTDAYQAVHGLTAHTILIVVHQPCEVRDASRAPQAAEDIRGVSHQIPPFVADEPSEFVHVASTDRHQEVAEHRAPGRTKLVPQYAHEGTYQPLAHPP